MTSRTPQLGVLRVLDLGCGKGCKLARHGIPEDAEVTGLDLAKHPDYPASRKFVLGRGEDLPFEDASFDAIISGIALPYMDIPQALAECRRVLRPCGEIHVTLHPFRFTLHELRESFPNPVAMVYRLWVMANGVVFHFTGRAFSESFQTERGMIIALARAGFENLLFSAPPAGNIPYRMKVIARKKKAGKENGSAQ